MATLSFKRTCVAFFTAVALTLGMLVGAAEAAVTTAETAWAANTGWTVTFNGSTMDSNGTSDLRSALSGMQPGDSATFTVNLANAYNGEADWYLRNSILKTMEEDAENDGGSYGYRLTYTDGTGATEVIYENQAVSGDASETTSTKGLYDATDATDEWFYLDTLSANGTGVVTLEVSLDPESHGNSYFDTEAELELAFAAEPKTQNQTTTNSTSEFTVDYGSPLTQTGDVVNIVVIAMVIVAAAVVMVVAFRKMRASKNGGER